MGRKENRARKARLGHKNQNFSSKTSPHALKARLLKREKDSLGRIYPRTHSKRASIKATLTKELGLPPDTVFIFRRPGEKDGSEEEREQIPINRGTIVVIDSQSLRLVLAVRCTQFKNMPPELRKNFNDTISNSYLHARARNKCDKHNSVAPLEEAGIYWGWMGCCGWRGASERGKSLGMFISIQSDECCGRHRLR